MRNFSIGSANMGRRNHALHVLLETNDLDDILCIQEPWWGRIGTKRADGEKWGIDARGGAANNKWDGEYPLTRTDRRAKVMTYVRKHNRNNPHRKNAITVVARNDLVQHPCLLIVDVHVDTEHWRIVNFYNDVEDPSALRTLCSLQLGDEIPTLLVGDFNLHSPTWSPLGWTPSTGTVEFEEWAATNTLELLTIPGLPTRRGQEAQNQRDSTLDLVWRNFAAVVRGTFQGALVDWTGSLGSDHALIRSLACTQFHVRSPRTEQTNSFDTDISELEWDEWYCLMKLHAPILRGVPRSSAEVDTIVDLIYAAFNTACSETMARKGSNKARASKWWTPDCLTAKLAVDAATTDDERRSAGSALKRTVRSAKRDWADRYVTTANVWEVAAWRHGRQQTRIPALCNPEGDLVYDHESMTAILSRRFFAEARQPIPLSLPGDPPPRPERTHFPISESEITPLLTQAANKTAPGFSGIGWLLLKRAWHGRDGDDVRWEGLGGTLTLLYEACLRLGHHPDVWKQATVAVIPKPDRPDYTQAKAHRPISLLETMSKLLEKVVAKRLQHDIVTHDLIHTTQFGGRAHSSCLDAGLTLLHDIQTAHSVGLKCGILLFDVQGFFDHVNHDRLVAVLRNMGFSHELTTWTERFLSHRRVRLRFNGVLSDEREQPIGVPQGSPLSPVLSIAYTSGLLGQMARWNNSSLGMYVDDGIIFACAVEWSDVTRLLRERYATCHDWLRLSGLAIEPDKSEVMFFQRPYARNPPPPPGRLTLLEGPTQYHVTPKETLRYLGFFLHRKLKWTPHATIMCNRARASISALKVLGNTVRGLSMANWRLVMNAVCLPVLTYGCQLWYKQGGKGVKGIVNMLQRVQNEMVKVTAGAFHTAPREALLEMTRMLPMRHHLEKLTCTSALRLYRLPRASQLLRRLGPAWYVPAPGDLGLPVLSLRAAGRAKPSSLLALAHFVPANGPRVHASILAPWETPSWQDHVTYMGAPRSRGARIQWSRDCVHNANGWSVGLIYTAGFIRHTPTGPIGSAAATFTVGGNPLTALNWHLGGNLLQFDANTTALAKAAEALALFYTEEVNMS